MYLIILKNNSSFKMYLQIIGKVKILYKGYEKKRKIIARHDTMVSIVINNNLCLFFV